MNYSFVVVFSLKNVKCSIRLGHQSESPYLDLEIQILLFRDSYCFNKNMKETAINDAAEICVFKGCTHTIKDNNNSMVLNKIKRDNEGIECEHYKRRCKFYVS